MRAGGDKSGRTPAILLVNRQRRVHLADWKRVLDLAATAVPFCAERVGESDARLAEFEEVEVAVVSDRVIAGVHRRFMNIPGATDVITFSHGEIVVSADTAAREAAERGEVLEREVLRYVVHGLLHLNGHEDAGADEAAAMWAAQEAVVGRLWPD